MELFQLRYFVKVAETLNFRRAAEALFISQPALSQQIRELERQLGLRLLQRDRQTVRLLPAGKRLYEGGKRLLAEADALLASMQVLREESMSDRLVLGFDREDDGLAEQMIGGPLYRLRKRCPELKLELEHISFEQAQEALDQGKIDVGLFMLRAADFEAFPYKKQVLWEDWVVLAVNAQAEGTPEELLERYPLIQLRNDLRWESVILEKARKINKKVRIKYVDTISRSMDYASLQLGVIPIVGSQAAQLPHLRILETGDGGGDARILVSALWKRENRWIGELLASSAAADR